MDPFFSEHIGFGFSLARSVTLKFFSAGATSFTPLLETSVPVPPLPTGGSEGVRSCVYKLVVLGGISLVQSIINLISVPSEIFDFELLTLPTVALGCQRLLSLAVIGFDEGGRPNRYQILFSFSFLIFFLLCVAIFRPLFYLVRATSTSSFSSPIAFLPSTSPTIRSSFWPCGHQRGRSILV